MLLGAAGIVAGDWMTVSGESLGRVKELGFDAVRLNVKDPARVNQRDIDRVRGMLRDAGLVLSQLVCDDGGSLVSPDDRQRADTVKAVKRTCNLGGKLGAAGVCFEPGSLNPKGSSYPHPDNYSEKVFDRLVEVAKDIARVAHNEGVRLAVQPAAASPLCSADRTAKFFEAIDSRALSLTMDPARCVDGFADAYDSGSMMDNWFEKLGHVTGDACARDYRVVESSLVHFEETILGQGLLDCRHFLTALQRVRPDGHVLIPSRSTEEAGSAIEHLKAVAGEAGVKLGTR